MSREYHIRFFFDLGSGRSFWAGDERTEAEFGYAIDPSKLPLSDALQARIRAIIEWYDTSLDWDAPSSPSPWSGEERARFNEAATALAEEVRAELGSRFRLTNEFLPV